MFAVAMTLTLSSCAKQKGDKPENADAEAFTLVLADFTMTDINGVERSIHEEAAKNAITIIDFWASWCAPCMGEMPELVQLYDNYRTSGLGIVGVSLDENAESWRKAVESKGMTWTQLSDLQGHNNSAAMMFGVRAIPFNVVVDSKCRIIATNLHGDDLSSFIKKRLESTGKPR